MKTSVKRAAAYFAVSYFAVLGVMLLAWLVTRTLIAPFFETGDALARETALLFTRPRFHLALALPGAIIALFTSRT